MTTVLPIILIHYFYNTSLKTVGLGNEVNHNKYGK